MKKTKIIICLILILTLLSCSKQKEKTTSENEKKLITKTEEILQKLNKKEFQEIIDLGDETLKKGLSFNTMKEAYESQIGELGTYKTILEKKVTKDETSITMILQYELGQLQLLCSFNEKHQLIGIFLKKINTTTEKTKSKNFETKEVKLHKGANMELNGELVKPNKKSEIAVIFISGSGPMDKDETMGPNKMFQDIAYELGENNITSLRYDKLFYTHPELAKNDIELEYTKTVEEAIKVLKNETNITKIYFIGHSLGGMLTPYYMNLNKEITGGIIMGGSLRSLGEIVEDQNKELIKTLPLEQQEENLKKVENEKNKLNNLQNENDNTTIFGISTFYLTQLENLKTNKLITENNKPLLILHGEKDFQINNKDFESFQKEEYKELLKYKTYKNLNHFFNESQGDISDIQKAYGTKSAVPKEVVNDIIEFMK